MSKVPGVVVLFQHAAARRRLRIRSPRSGRIPSFNTQPPVGGWCCILAASALPRRFQHAAARRRLTGRKQMFRTYAGFNTQPPVGGWEPGIAQELLPGGFNTQPPVGGCRHPAFQAGCAGSVSTRSRP